MSDYKYLGCWVNEVGNNTKTIESMTSAASHSYGCIVVLFKQLGDMAYWSFCTLYNSYILPIANSVAAVWGCSDHSAARVLQNCIMRFHLGIHHFAPVAATSIEMDMPNIQHVRWLELVRFHNRVMLMENHR